MGRRGPKSRFNDVACPNERCRNYNKAGTGTIAANGSYATQSGRVHKFICRECGRVFCQRQGTAFYDLRSPEDKVILALKLVLQGMSLRAVSNVLEVKLDTVRSWLTKSAAHAQQVNEVLVKEIKVSRVELDELWSFVRKKNFRAWQKTRQQAMGLTGYGSHLHQSID